MPAGLGKALLAEEAPLPSLWGQGEEEGGQNVHGRLQHFQFRLVGVAAASHVTLHPVTRPSWSTVQATGLHSPAPFSSSIH